MKNLFQNKRLASYSSFLKPVSQILIVLFPNLFVELDQAEYKVKPLTFVSISIYTALLFSLLLGGVLAVLFYYLSALTSNNAFLIIGASLVLLVFSFFNLVNSPKMYLLKKGREIDTSLLFALRHVLIKVKSGIPFFDSIVGIAYGNYGAVSNEFRKYVKDVEGGTNEIIALEKLSFYNPSAFLRRFIWQMTNSLRAGTDIASTLEVIVEDIENERYLQVKAFGSRLSPIALLYIMFTIILPALGTTFMTVFAVFLGGRINNEYFYVIPVLLVVVNLFFMNVIKNARPVFEMN